MSRQREGDTGRQTDVVGRDIEWRRYIVVVLSMHVCDVFSCCTRTEAGSSFCEECTLPLAYSHCTRRAMSPYAHAGGLYGHIVRSCGCGGGGTVDLNVSLIIADALSSYIKIGKLGRIHRDV